MAKMIFNPLRLKAERIAIGMSQDDIAEKLGKTRSWYAKRENGFVNIGADELAAIANVLKIDDMSIFFTTIVPDKQLQN